MSIPISVMTIIHNGEPFVERCYCNLLAETFTEWEWVVVNDGSDDRTEALLRTIEKREPRLRLMSYPKNRGRGHARTVALEQSRGAWVAVWDVDDLYFPNRLDRIDEARLKHLDFYTSTAIVLDQQLRFIGVRGWAHPWPPLDIRTGCHAAMAVRLDLAREIGYLPHLKTVGQIGEDVPMVYLPALTRRGLHDDEPTFINVIGNEVFLRKSIDANTIRAEFMEEIFQQGKLPLSPEQFAQLANADRKKLRILKSLQLCPPLYRAVMSFRPRGELVEGQRLTPEQDRFLDQFRHQNGKA